MSLHPGDVISTGTPPGVGMGQKPPQYLRSGDVVELGIDGLGSQRQGRHGRPGMIFERYHHDRTFGHVSTLDLSGLCMFPHMTRRNCRRGRKQN